MVSGLISAKLQLMELPPLHPKAASLQSSKHWMRDNRTELAYLSREGEVSGGELPIY